MFSTIIISAGLTAHIDTLPTHTFGEPMRAHVTNEDEPVKTSSPKDEEDVPTQEEPTTYEIATNGHLTQLDTYSHDLLARLVTAESRNEPFEGKVAVAEVVLNRIASNEFPNSLYEVIYQENQFQPVRNGTINEHATDLAKQAVDEALNGSNIAQDALFFYNYQTAESRWLDSLPTITQIGNHTFK